MRIACPFCGERDSGEFTYRGDADPARPEAAPLDPEVDGTAEIAAFHDYVYLRDNPAGPMREHWYHGGGCRSWLVVTRDTRSHAVLAVEPAAGAGAQPAAKVRA
jgi:methylglutamate dehydrogenase subunit B